MIAQVNKFLYLFFIYTLTMNTQQSKRVMVGKTNRPRRSVARPIDQGD